MHKRVDFCLKFLNCKIYTQKILLRDKVRKNVFLANKTRQAETKMFNTTKLFFVRKNFSIGNKLKSK